jgi:hypothetical protein
MVELNVVGRQVSIEGHGTEDEPFIVHGIKKNPALVAIAEEAMIDHWMGEGNWEMLKTRLEHCPKGRVLAILTVLTTDDENKPIKGDIWFDVTEAFAA